MEKFKVKEDKGKAYANKRAEGKRPIGDMYHTPKSLVWVAKNIIEKEFDISKSIYEPACGEGSISEELEKIFKTCVSTDLYKNGIDYLLPEVGKFQIQIITNPPFSQWDDFVVKAKTHCKKFMFIGRLNYLGTNSRLKNGIWKNLKAIYAFSRYADYQTPYRKDGLFHVGAMATAWFLWDMNFTESPIIEILDVNKFAKLGAYKNHEK